MEQPVSLSIEQQFQMRSFQDQVMKMSLDQTQQHLVALFQHMMLRENEYKALLKKQWGIESPQAGGEP